MKSDKVNRKKASWMGRVALLLGIVASLTTVIGFIRESLGFNLLDEIVIFFFRNPLWFWDNAIWIFLMFVLAGVAGVLTWFPKPFTDYVSDIRRRPRRIIIGLLLNLMACGVAASLITGAMLRDTFPSDEAELLFPTAASFGPVFIRTFATNGSVNYRFHATVESGGPDQGYSEIQFRLFGRDPNYNGGWVIYLTRGANLSRYNELRFLIRGEHGGEKIGVKAKDARGVEVEVPYEDLLLPQQDITTDWQEVKVPFDYFGQVDFSLMENFSLYVTGEMIGTVPETVLVGGFRLMTTTAHK